MSLSPGSRLGVYEVTAEIGAGGMGIVYRARDTKLGRDVALKVLPDVFADDPERLARFQREARVLASLNHPNIASIYGLEESGDTRALVLELVEGPTLAERIAQGAIPIDEALPIARQIADALEAAHEAGVIHRDLKPANIKVKADGMVKVLDFGLAKALSPELEGDPSESPTLTAAATQKGVIMGTAAYMSPEQARGKVVDKRADIFAFGAVLFEMLTGKRAFEGRDVSETLGGVLRLAPDWDTLPANTPPRLSTLLRRCLEKELRQRVQAVGDVRLAMEGAFETVSSVPGEVAAARQPSLWQNPRLLVVVLVLSAVIGGLASWGLTRADSLSEARVTRLTIDPPLWATPLLGGRTNNLAISPDGAQVVYQGENGTLFVRALQELEPTLLAELGSPQNPFFSPDGQWIGFFQSNAFLQRIAITGGPPIMICPLDGGTARGATWGEDGTIIFATTGSSGLQRVQADGQRLTVLTTPDRERGEGNHVFPRFVPGGNAVLFNITAAPGGSRDGVAVLDLRTETYKMVVPGGSDAHYLPTGHLVYVAGNSLRAVPFDLARLEVATTASIPVVPAVATTAAGQGIFDVSLQGTIVYSADAGETASRTLVWVDRQGEEEHISAPPRTYLYPRLSPDGTRLALDIRDEENDIWIWDFPGETLSRLTREPGVERFPVWMPDGDRLLFTSDRAGPSNLFSQMVDSGGTAERLIESSVNQMAMSVSPDGGRLVFREGGNLMMLSLDNEPAVQPLVEDPFFLASAVISPDGRWLAYSSNESGQYEVYVRPFPDAGGGRRQVSTSGGRQPTWNPNGGELFFFAATDELMGVRVGQSSEWDATTPTRVVRSGYALGNVAAAATYDISPDGERFIMIKRSVDRGSVSAGLVVVQNWFEELKELVPVP